MKKSLLMAVVFLTTAACTPKTPDAPSPAVSDQVQSSSDAALPAASAPDDMTFQKGQIQLQSPDGKLITLQVELANTYAQQERGLMNRTELPEGTGMLFSFDAEQPLNFWMKNTLIPLDIVYLDADGAFVSSTTMVPCVEDPCATYPSAGPAMRALELPVGYIKKMEIGEGWRLMIGE